MKPFVSRLLLFTCALLLAYACRHSKTAVSRGKVKKQVAVKQAPKQAVSPKPSGSGESNSASGNAALHQKLGLTDKQIHDSPLFSFISDWYSVPYKYGGCQKTGIDCSCFTNLLFDKVYNRKIARSAADIYKDCNKLTLDEVREGDLLFFKIGSNSISHVGVYLKNNLFVHASTSKGVMISSMEEAYFKKYFHAGGRLKNI